MLFLQTLPYQSPRDGFGLTWTNVCFIHIFNYQICKQFHTLGFNFLAQIFRNDTLAICSIWKKLNQCSLAASCDKSFQHDMEEISVLG